MERFDPPMVVCPFCLPAAFSLGLLYDQATVAVPEWGSGRDGLRRGAEWLGSGYAARFTAEFAAAKLLGHDTGYQRCQCKGFPRRAAHALHSEFVERRSDGPPVFATARLTGAVYANDRALPALAIDEGFNMLQEFWPEIKRTLLLRRLSARR